MAGTSAYPTALDNNTNLNENLADNVDTVSAAHQNNQNRAIKELQEKVGITDSTATTTKVLIGGASAGTSAWCTVSGDATISNSGVITVSSISGTAVYINETANAKSTIGLTINQGANDDEILALKSSDIGHGLTTLGSEADTYAAFQKTSATLGGLQITSIAQDDALTTPTVIKSFGGTADTTKSTSGVGLIDLYVAEHDGSDTVANITADGNIFSVRAKTGGSDLTKFLVDEDGDAYIFGAATVTGTVTAGGTVLTGATAAPALTEINGTANRAMYVNGSGDVTEIALGAAGTVLAGNGTSAAPAFENITATDINGGTWKVFYTNGSGDVIEVGLGADGTVLQSNGGAVAPTFEAAGGGDDMIVGRSFGGRPGTNPPTILNNTSFGAWYYNTAWYD
jgi:hypothetical protein|tara:strand:- start:1191 stop:2384 length:1194 start_codon:yes stop_codon:yes gene_type:complete